MISGGCKENERLTRLVFGYLYWLMICYKQNQLTGTKNKCESINRNCYVLFVVKPVFVKNRSNSQVLFRLHPEVVEKNGFTIHVRIVFDIAICQIISATNKGSVSAMSICYKLNKNDTAFMYLSRFLTEILQFLVQRLSKELANLVIHIF